MKKILFMALAVAISTACHQNGIPGAAPESISGNVTIEPVITKATEVNFEAGDMIGITMKKVNDTDNYAENEMLAFTDGVFSGDLKWYADAYSESDILAYYPYEVSGTPSTFSVTLDQTEGLGSSDFMAASKKGVFPTLGAVTMVFRHQMTKLAINIDNQTGSPVSEVLVQNTVPTAALAAEDLSASAAEGEETADIKAYEVTPNTAYSAIIVPQTAAIKISVVFENMKVMTQPLASMTLKAGGQYTVDVRVLADDMTVSASGEIQNWTDEGKIEIEGGSEVEELPVTFNEYEGYFEYDGVRYNTVQLADGNTWMAENLRFIPRGRTVSSDPAENTGIWYPAANAEKVADPSLVESLGLLYDAATAFGVEELTAENAGSFEGCQGICPTGWHIPTKTEMTALVGQDGAYYDGASNGASIAALAEAGWPWQFAGLRNRASVSASGSYLVTNYNGIYGVMSYIIGSTCHQSTTNDDGSLKNIQYHYLMSLYNASNEKISVAYGNFLSGASVRCIKNK